MVAFNKKKAALLTIVRFFNMIYIFRFREEQGQSIILKNLTTVAKLLFWSGSMSARCLDDLEEYTNSSERSRIRSATVESAERDHCLVLFCFVMCFLLWAKDGATIAMRMRVPSDIRFTRARSGTLRFKLIVRIVNCKTIANDVNVIYTMYQTSNQLREW